MTAWPAAVRAHSDVVTQTVGEELVLLNLRTGVYWGLNCTGAFVWAELARHGSPREALGAMSRRYTAGEPQLAAALEKLLQDLIGAGLLVAAASEAAPGSDRRA